MKFKIIQSELVQTLKAVVGVAGRSMDREIMGNLLLETTEEELILTASDAEVELTARLPSEGLEPGKTTVPAKKLFDICRSVGSDSIINFQLKDEKAVLRIGKSRLTLATLPVKDFPLCDPLKDTTNFTIPQDDFASAIARTSFAVAKNDARHFLNGLLLELNPEELCFVSTDGHRLALHRVKMQSDVDSTKSVIVPGKAIAALPKVLDTGGDDDLAICFNTTHLKAEVGNLCLITKLIDGKYPDYRRVIPTNDKNIASVDRITFKTALNRSVILSNETYRGVALSLDKDIMDITTHNPKAESSSNELPIDYQGDNIKVGFNVNYLIDALNAMDSENTELRLGDPNEGLGSLVMRPEADLNSTFVVMAMRL